MSNLGKVLTGILNTRIVRWVLFKMAGRRTCLSVLVFLLHLLVIKAKFCANKPSDKVSIKSRYLTEGLPNAIHYDVSD